jgi:hypothetical protein
MCLWHNATGRCSCTRHEALLLQGAKRPAAPTLVSDAMPKALEMNADAWNHLDDRSRVLVHHVSRLMGVLTHPTQSRDDYVLRPIAAEATVALESLLEQMQGAPELAAHLRTLQRFDIALAAWRRSVAEASPLLARYQTALLQQAAQIVTSCLHVGALAASEAARVLVIRGDPPGRPGPPQP